jgi:hypothetical protein
VKRGNWQTKILAEAIHPLTLMTMMMMLMMMLVTDVYD